jgi:hypothetical protein
MISGLTLLRTDDAPGNRERWSYVLMAEELRRARASGLKLESLAIPIFIEQ